MHIDILHNACVLHVYRLTRRQPEGKGVRNLFLLRSSQGATQEVNLSATAVSLVGHIELRIPSCAYPPAETAPTAPGMTRNRREG